jgi:hypothetical protein
MLALLYAVIKSIYLSQITAETKATEVLAYSSLLRDLHCQRSVILCVYFDVLLSNAAVTECPGGCRISMR